MRLPSCFLTGGAASAPGASASSAAFGAATPAGECSRLSEMALPGLCIRPVKTDRG